MWLPLVLLSTLGWALVNVLDSVLVHRYEKMPMALMWSQSFLSLPLLLSVPLLVDVQTSWVFLLCAFGMIGYLGDLWFFRLLEAVDVSVVNAAWALLSLLLSVVGLVFFYETWSWTQSLGACFILSGVFLISFYHQHLSLRRTLTLLSVLALLYAPYYIVKKVAIDANVAPLTVFFWMMLGRELLSLSVPMFRPHVRAKAFKAMRHPSFALVNVCVIFSFFLAELTGAWAYESGPLSLTAIAGNTQPFMVMVLAFLFAYFFPRSAPKELFTRQSVQIKFISFLVVFTGLALLAGSK